MEGQFQALSFPIKPSIIYRRSAPPKFDTEWMRGGSQPSRKRVHADPKHRRSLTKDSPTLLNPALPAFITRECVQGASCQPENFDRLFLSTILLHLVEAGPITDKIIAGDPVEWIVNSSRVERLSRAAPAILRSSRRGRIPTLAILFGRPHLMLAAGCCPLSLRLNRGVDHCETPACHRLRAGAGH